MIKETSRVLSLAIAVLLSITVGYCGGETVMRVADRQEISFPRMIEEIKGKPLIFIGEDHDRMADHILQLKVIKALNEAGIPLAIGLEMFTAESRDDLKSWVAGRMNEEDFVRRFYDNWNEPWPYYRGIFLYAREHSIPMAGLNLPREISHKVASMGFAALTAAERRQVPGAITCKVDAGYMALVRRAFAEHKLSDETFIRFCEAQILWNRTMAWNAIAYMRGHPGRIMVVLAGKGHAMKPGIPEELKKMKSMDLTVILPEDEIFNGANVSKADTDFLFEK